MKLGEDERPVNFTSVHEWEGRKYWNLMARSISVVSPTVLEVKYLFGNRVRAICFAMVLMWGVLPALVSMYHGDPPLTLYKRSVDSFMLTFFPEAALEDTYHFYNDSRLEEDKVTLDRFVADYVAWRPFADRFGQFAFDMSLPLIILVFGYFAFFLPAHAPIRVDREKRLIYTRRGRHLYVKKLPYDFDLSVDWRDRTPLDDGMRGWKLEHIVPVLSNVGNGHFRDVLAVEMHRIDQPEKKRIFRLGAYPLTHRPTQGEDILHVIYAFSYLPEPGRTGSAAQPYDPAWQSRLYRDKPLALDWLRWLTSRTLGRRHRLDDAKIEDQLLEYATRKT